MSRTTAILVGVFVSIGCGLETGQRTGPHSATCMVVETDSAAWRKWFDSCAHSVYHRHSVGDILRELAGPADLQIESGADLHRTVDEFDAGNVTRREALERLSKEFQISARAVGVGDPERFLGVLETEEERTPQGITTMTHVRVVDYGCYLKSKGQGKVASEQRKGGFVYYSLEASRCFEQSDRVRGHFTVTERFKTRAPEE